MAHRNTLPAVGHFLTRRHLPLEHETGLFILVSALDFWMTYQLLMHPEAMFVESNPIALWFLHHWGLKGMLFFKMSIVAIVAVICQVIALQNVQTARRVLWAGITIVGSVVIYSAGLFAGAA